MEHQQLREIILTELPSLLQTDPSFREAVLQITRAQFADKTETQNRFDRMMDELIHNRQLLEQRWQEDNRRWHENEKRWKENEERWKENEERWKENQQQLKESQQRWEEKWQENQQQLRESQQQWEKQWQENQQRWEANHKELVKLTNALQNLDTKFERKFDQTLGALGARWGLYSESAFRNALAGILTDFPNVEVVNVNDYDDDGIVFGHPEQVELDLIIKNGVLMICEIKSSTSKSDMYIFAKKVRFYEQKHNRTANRMIVISPMIDDKAKIVAEKLGIETYSYAEEVKL